MRNSDPKNETIDIIQKRIIKGGQLAHAKETHAHAKIARILERKLYPKMLYIADVYEDALLWISADT